MLICHPGCVGPSPVLTGKPKKCSVWTHLTVSPKKMVLPLFWRRNRSYPCLQCILITVHLWTLFLTSASGREVDTCHHLLDFLFILQYVGPHGTNLVLLVLDQLVQLSQFCFERLYRPVCCSAAHTSMHTWTRRVNQVKNKLTNCLQ